MYFLCYFVVCSFVRKSAKLSSLYSWKISFPYLLSVEASALITKRLWYNFLLEVCKLWWWFEPQIYMFLNEWSDMNNSIRLIGKIYMATDCECLLYVTTDSLLTFNFEMSLRSKISIHHMTLLETGRSSHTTKSWFWFQKMYSSHLIWIAQK